MAPWRRALDVAVREIGRKPPPLLADRDLEHFGQIISQRRPDHDRRLGHQRVLTTVLLERIGEREYALEAVFGVPCHGLGDDGTKPVGHERHRLGRIAGSGHHDRRRGPAGVRQTPFQQLVQHHAESVDVRAMIDVRRRLPLLASHVRGGAHGRITPGDATLLRIRAEDVGDPEVHDLDERVAVLLSQKYVLRLEVAVDDALCVCGRKPLTHAQDDVQRFALAHAPSIREQIAERGAHEQLHDEKVDASTRRASIPHVDDMRALHRGCRARLLEKSTHDFTIAVVLGSERFNDNRSVEFTRGLVDLTECPRTKTALDRIGIAALGVGHDRPGGEHVRIVLIGCTVF